MRKVFIWAVVATTAFAFPAAAAVDETPKRCANGHVGLTFDDGPTRSTVKLLAKLKKHRLRATMFNLGQRAEQRPDDVRAQVKAGMWVANHSFTHRNLTQLDETELADEISRTQSTLAGITGAAPKLFRPPFLLTNEAVRAEVDRQGLQEVLATIDTRDASGASVAEIVAAVRRVRSGGIVLLHDGPAATRKAIPKIAEALAEKRLCAGRIQPTTVESSVKSFDGTKIALHWYRAPGATAKRPAPTVLSGPGFTHAGAPRKGPQVQRLLNAGYNVMTWDPRGFGDSEGTVHISGADYEGRDVQALLDWLAKRPEALLDGKKDPRVGMVGRSYSGGIQWVVAAIDGRVDAIVPDLAWHSLLTSLYKDATFKVGWGYGMAVGSGRRADPHIQSMLLEGGAGKLSRGTRKWLTGRGPGQLMKKVRAPTLIIQGTHDNLFTLQEAVDNWKILRGNGVPVKMLWGCFGHGLCNTPAGRGQDLLEQKQMAWLARYVKRDRSAPTGRRFTWVDQRGKAHTAPDYPPASSGELTASGSGTLTMQEEGGSGPLLNPYPGWDFGAMAARFGAAKADNAVNVRIATPAGGQQVAGAPQLSLTYSGTAEEPDARVFAQIVDDATGKVLGNNITPIPVTLDGRQHTVKRPLEIVAATTRAGSSFTLQLVASSTAYGPPRSPGTVTFSKARVSLPVVG